MSRCADHRKIKETYSLITIKMKEGLSMYSLRNIWLKQINTAIGLEHKPGIDLRVHWLNPLLIKCEKRLYPDKVL